MPVEKVGNSMLIRINDFSGGLVDDSKIPLLEMSDNQFSVLQGVRLNKTNRILKAVPKLSDTGNTATTITNSTLINAIGSYMSNDAFYIATSVYTSPYVQTAVCKVDGTSILSAVASTGASSTKTTITFGSDAFRFGFGTGDHALIMRFFSYAATLYYNKARTVGWTRGLQNDSTALSGFDVYKNSTFQDDVTIDVNSISASGSFVATDKVDYAISTITDDGQESKLIFNRDVSVTIGAGNNCVDVDMEVDTSQYHAFLEIRYFNIYRSINDGDFYLWKQLDTQARIACYDDSNTAIRWSNGASGNSAIVNNIKDYGTVLVDSYESRTGYYGSTRQISGTTTILEEDAGTRWVTKYSTDTMALNRHIIGNVKIDSEIYNDRIYVSPPDKFDSFPEDRYILIGEDDGDSIQAISSIANRYIVVFKRNHTYIIDASSVSETGWYLAKSFQVGTSRWRSVVYSDYGVCFTNDDGAWIITNRLKLEELSKGIKWSTYNYSNPTGYYIQKYTEYMVMYSDNDAIFFNLSNGMVTTQILTDDSGTIGIPINGKPDDNQDYLFILETTTLDIYEMDNSSTTYQSNKIVTAPLHVNRYGGTKFKQLYIAYKGDADYGIGTSTSSIPTAGTNMSDFSTTKGTEKIRIGTTANFLRIAVSNFTELEEIAALVTPTSTRRIDNIGGVA